MDTRRCPLMTQSGHRQAPFCPLPVCQFGPLRCLALSFGGVCMRRRAFMKVFVGLAGYPLVAAAEQASLPVIGFVNAGSADGSVSRARAFLIGLGEAGYTDGQNVKVEYHWLEGKSESLPAIMTDLVRRQVAVIATP